jgi:hypothetical protein
MAVRRVRDQREQAAQKQGDPALDVEYKKPTHAEPSPLSSRYACTRRQCFRSGPQTLPARTKSLGHLQLKTPYAISALTTYSLNNSRAAFTRPPASNASATKPAA